jgi:hypothetical protein
VTSSVQRMSQRDQEILSALAVKVRLFSQRQIAEHWWNGDMANTRRRLKQFAFAGLLIRLLVPARTLPELASPLVRWSPGDATPDFGAIAYRCQSRWRYRHIHPTTVWIASEKAAQLYGAPRRGELKQPTQATHDLGVAAVWLRMREVAPAWAEAWRGEDCLAHTRRGEKIPDAFVVDGSQEVQWVIEFAGGYSAERVRAFHDDCALRHLPYQLW